MNSALIHRGFLLVLAVTLALSACTPTPEPTVVSPTFTSAPTRAELPVSPPPTATVAPPLEPTATVEVSAAKADLTVSKNIRLDPAVATDADSLLISGYLYEGLVALDGAGNPIPLLATGWTVSDDALDYVFELRPNVIFHDGTPFNADAVVANFMRWFDPADPLRGSGTYQAWQAAFLGFRGEVDEKQQPLSLFDGIEKVNDLTVLIHLNRPEPDLLTKLAQPAFALVSPSAMAANVDAFGMQAGGAAGTGPYRLLEWTENGLVLAPNTAYWGTPPTANLVVAWKGDVE